MKKFKSLFLVLLALFMLVPNVKADDGVSSPSAPDNKTLTLQQFADSINNSRILTSNAIAEGTGSVLSVTAIAAITNDGIGISISRGTNTTGASFDYDSSKNIIIGEYGKNYKDILYLLADATSQERNEGRYAAIREKLSSKDALVCDLDNYGICVEKNSSSSYMLRLELSNKFNEKYLKVGQTETSGQENPTTNPATDPTTDPTTNPTTDPATDPATDPTEVPKTNEETYKTYTLQEFADSIKNSKLFKTEGTTITTKIEGNKLTITGTTDGVESSIYYTYDPVKNTIKYTVGEIGEEASFEDALKEIVGVYFLYINYLDLTNDLTEDQISYIISSLSEDSELQEAFNTNKCQLEEYGVCVIEDETGNSSSIEFELSDKASKKFFKVEQRLIEFANQPKGIVNDIDDLSELFPANSSSDKNKGTVENPDTGAFLNYSMIAAGIAVAIGAIVFAIRKNKFYRI